MMEAEVTIAAQAWRVEFAEGATAARGEAEAIAIAEPRTVTAVLTALPLEAAFAQVGPQPAEALTVIWMPPGVNTPATIERDVDEWVRGAGTERKEANTRADVRTVRVVWGKNRTVIYANESDIRAALDAVLRFTLTQREALALGSTMRAMWSSIESDATFTHALAPRDRKRQPHINAMTESVTRMKIAWLRLKASLEQVDPALTEASKRLFAELVAAVSLYDQVDVLGPKIQFALDHYEIANTRLIDMTLVRQERIESIAGYGLIIVLLIFQTWLMLWDMFWAT